MPHSTSLSNECKSTREKPFTEEDWTDETNRSDTSPYDRAKTIAERAAWAWLAAEGGGLELVTVNPGLVLGPVLGSDFSASIEAIKKLMDGSIPALPRFGFNVVDVRDIARLHVLAMTTPEAAGQRFRCQTSWRGLWRCSIRLSGDGYSSWGSGDRSRRRRLDECWDGHLGR